MVIYIILAAVSVVLLLGSICTCFKLGDRDGICNYDYKKGDNEQ